MVVSGILSRTVHALVIAYTYAARAGVDPHAPTPVSPSCPVVILVDAKLQPACLEQFPMTAWQTGGRQSAGIWIRAQG